LGVRENKREKVKDKEKSTTLEQKSEQSQAETIAETNEKMSEAVHTPEAVVELPAQEEEGETEAAAELAVTSSEVQLEPKYVVPPWGSIEESEWMYGIPPRESDLMLWTEEWGDYLLQWAEANKIHVLSIATFISEPPFKDMRSKVDAFRVISEGLIDKRVAEWVDKKERQIRVYWKPLEDWADEVYTWSLKTGKLRLDVKSMVIQEAAQDFSRLPEDDLYKILAIMVTRGLADWVDKKRGAVVVET
jgi:hypothetical protein